jgi:hypothetical protein
MKAAGMSPRRAHAAAGPNDPLSINCHVPRNAPVRIFTNRNITDKRMRRQIPEVREPGVKRRDREEKGETRLMWEKISSLSFNSVGSSKGFAQRVRPLSYRKNPDGGMAIPRSP